MKTCFVLCLCFLLPASASAAAPSAADLIGTWRLDLRPTPDAEPYYQQLVVSRVEGRTIEGSFYGTEFSGGHLNPDWGTIRFAFTTRDGSSEYYSVAEFDGDTLRGTTHAPGRGMLSVWNGVRADDEKSTPRVGVRRAVMDYVDAIYEVAPELIDKSVSPKLQKLGYMPARDGSGPKEYWMSFDELRDLAARINQNGQFDPETAPREISILDIGERIATVKLVAAWGVDYIHLTRHSGEWMIMNVIWEAPAE